jgi:hypothetical protein
VKKKEQEIGAFKNSGGIVEDAARAEGATAALGARLRVALSSAMVWGFYHVRIPQSHSDW